MTDDANPPSDAEIIESYFEQLKGGVGYEITSPSTVTYNCLAWALGINWTRYDPSPRVAGYYWFPGVPREWNLTNVTQVFVNHGYTVCDNHEVEDGFEKIVMYIDEDGVPQHFAKQLVNGKWSSKLGDLNDISHDALETLHVPEYGKATFFMKRRVYIAK